MAYQRAAERARLIPPVPGGMAPMTIVMLLAKTVDAAEMDLLNPAERSPYKMGAIRATRGMGGTFLCRPEPLNIRYVRLVRPHPFGRRPRSDRLAEDQRQIAVMDVPDPSCRKVPMAMTRHPPSCRMREPLLARFRQRPRHAMRATTSSRAIVATAGAR